ncbi:chaperone modulator CbpM [Synechococcus sp. CBW1107]|uniref:chaperone modulator CbpM n=1 Tax=Synechococcus sp. CBW1107 TaxID=2789857 RepID=UPI002AD2730F|nr:chaperone modulator CbpM [Synechococcus sp. CBW1107]CAK6695101.1 Chaperone modulatory protein CbpM [Synechococcus sp. CBW1107]
MADDLLIPVESESRVELEELLAASGLEHGEVVELVQFGVFETRVSASGWSFHSCTIHKARRAADLRNTFGLNPPGMAIALTYLEKIEALEHRLRELECLLPR